MSNLAQIDYRDRADLVQKASESPLSIAVFDDHMAYLACSPRWCADNGLAAPPLGRTQLEAQPGLSPAWRDVHLQALAGHVLSALDERVARADGDTLVCNWLAYPWRDRDGHVAGTILACEDSGTRQETRQVWQDSRHHLRALIDALPLVVVYFDPQERFLVASRRAQEWLARTSEQLEGRRMAEVLGPERYAKVEPGVRRVLAGTRTTFTTQMRHPDGKWRHVRSTYVPDRRPDGSLVGFYAIVEDITDLELALAESKSMLGSVVDAIPDLLFLRDADGRMRMANAAVLDLIGRPLSEVLGRTRSEIFCDQPRIDESTDGDHQVLASGRPLVVEQRLTVHGEPRDYLITKSPWRDEQGEVAGVVGSGKDITELKRLQAELRRQAEANEVLLQLVGEAIHVVDAEGRLVRANAAFARHLGYDEAGLAGLRVGDWDVALSEAQAREHIQRMMAEPGTMTTRHRRRDGTLVDVRITAQGVELEGRRMLYVVARPVGPSAPQAC